MNQIESRLIKYASNIISLSNNLCYSDASSILRKQIIRSATSVALNYAEAQNAGSKKDFINKLRIAYKELRETKVNLYIIKEAKLLREMQQLNKMISETGELLAIFTVMIKTANKNNNSER